MNEHRASLLRRIEDPESSRDPRVQSIVEGLRDLDYAPAPRQEFRAELRAQLVAIAPRLIDESRTDAAASPTADAATSHQLQRRRIRLARPLGLATAVVAAFALLLGGAVALSQKALPGDSLYSLKRTSENVRLSLTSGDTDRGHEYLSLATTRVQEAQSLVTRTSAMAAAGPVMAGGISAQTAALVTSTLRSADADVRNGSSMLGDAAISSRSSAPLSILRHWAPGQLARLQDLSQALGSQASASQASSSSSLVHEALSRAEQLRPGVTCAHPNGSDEFGPLPGCGSAAVPASIPPTDTVTAPRSTPSADHHKSGATTSGAQPSGAQQQSPSGSPTSGSDIGSSPSVGVTHSGPHGSGLLPSLPHLPGTRHKTPTPKRSHPLSVGSCGVSASLGPVGVHVSACPSHS